MMPITTVILAGGAATRMGGDKGLRLLHGRALLDWVLDKVRPHSAEILLSLNTDNQNYVREGCRIIKDIENNVGPLAGLQAALHHARHEWVASVPCDTPFLPDDLLPQLLAALQHSDAEVAVAAQGGQRHPTIALYRKNVSKKLDIFLSKGQRKVGDWLNTLKVREVPFDDTQDSFTQEYATQEYSTQKISTQAFLNINSTQDLQHANQAPSPLIAQNERLK